MTKPKQLAPDPTALADTLVRAGLPDDAEIETDVPLDSLKRHPRNPRKGNREKIRKSIDLHGFADVVIAQKSTRFIIAGWHRADVAREMGYAAAPLVIWRDVDDDEALRQVLDYNKASDDAEYEQVVLRDILRDLEATTEGLGATLFTGDDLLDLRRVTGDLAADAADFLDAARNDDPRVDRRPDMAGQGLDRALTMQFTFASLEEREQVTRCLNLARQDRGESMASVLARVANDWLDEHDA